MFDLLKKDNLGKADRKRVKQAGRDLVESINAILATLDRFWEKEETKADVEVLILDKVFAILPIPPFTDDEKKAVVADIYTHIWHKAVGRIFGRAA